MKKKLISVLLGVMLFVPGIVNAATYEYLVISVSSFSFKASIHKKHAKAINKHAKDGWRLVNIIFYSLASVTYFYFEREVAE